MKKIWKAIPKEVWILGFVSLCMDSSSELIHSLLPLFMVTQLGATMIEVGFLEGFAEALSLILKFFSGALSDYLNKRKWLTLIGYTLSALSKPLFPLATTLKMVFTARALDRVGKGLRGAPRDALLSELSPPEIRGACFGLRQALDTLGACFGPLFAILGLAFFHDNIRQTMWLAIPPALLCIVLLAFFVQEPVSTPETALPHKEPAPQFHFSLAFSLGKRYWQMLLIAMVFTLARFSDAFLLLKAQNLELSLHTIPFVLLVMNLVYALAAYPAGWLSDRWSRSSMLFLGSLFLIAANLLLAFSTGYNTLFLGVMLWGIHMGLTQGVLSAMVADSTFSTVRGSGYGIFYFSCGIMTLLSSVFAGLIWDHYGPFYTFIAGACVACLASLILLGCRHSVEQN